MQTNTKRAKWRTGLLGAALLAWCGLAGTARAQYEQFGYPGGWILTDFDPTGFTTRANALFNGDTNTISTMWTCCYATGWSGSTTPTSGELGRIPFSCKRKNKTVQFWVHPTQIGDGSPCSFKQFKSLKFYSSPFSTSAHETQGHLTTVRENAFAGHTNLTYLEFPTNVVAVGTDAFKGCSNLETLCLDGPASLPTGILSGLGKLKDVHLNGLKTAPAGLLKGYSKLGRAEVRGLEELPANFFQNCTSLTNVVMKPKKIGAYAFSGCKNYWTYGDRLNDTTTDIGAHAFENTSLCGDFLAVYNGYVAALPEGVTNIGDYAFSKCTNLRRMALPTTLRHLGSHAFEGCSNLGTLDTTWGVPNVDSYAFAGCKKLSKIRISGKTLATGGAKKIGACAFAGCTNLSSVDMSVGSTPASKTITRIEANAFSNCVALKSFAIPSTVTNIGAQAFIACKGLKTVTVPSGVRNLGPSAFKWCSGLTNVVISGNLTNLYAGEERPFEGCTKLVKVTFNGKASKVPQFCCWKVSTLQKVALGASVTRIESHAFRACTNLVSPTLPDGLTFIGGLSFYGCSRIASLKIPQGVTFIGTNAFFGCTGLKKLEVPATWKGTKMLASSGLPSSCTVSYYAVASAQTVTFDGNGGTASIADKVYTIGKTYGELATATRPGCAFAGWWTAPDGGTQVTAASTVSSVSAQTLFAHWTFLETTTTPAAVPCAWLESNAPEILAAADGDHEAAANAPAANGMPVWECYVAGLSTTDAQAEFKVKSVTVLDGDVQIEWDPDLNEAGTTNARTYIVQGKPTMTNDWGATNAASRFFRVKVSLPAP